MLRLEMDALIADLTAEAGALAADDADAHGTDPVAAAAALQAEIDAVRRAELVHAQLGLADDVSVVDPDAPTPEPETLTAVVATNGVNAPDELRGVTDLAPPEIVPRRPRTTRRRSRPRRTPPTAIPRPARAAPPTSPMRWPRRLTRRSGAGRARTTGSPLPSVALIEGRPASVRRRSHR